MHNLGKFDGIFLIKGLLKIVHYNNVKTIINKENEFIEINAKIDNFKFIWKDSLRIFNISLKELCEIFNSKTKKLHSYKSEYNNIQLFNEKDRETKNKSITTNIKEMKDMVFKTINNKTNNLDIKGKKLFENNISKNISVNGA